VTTGAERSGRARATFGKASSPAVLGRLTAEIGTFIESSASLVSKLLVTQAALLPPK
jgi:hypothetical protein